MPAGISSFSSCDIPAEAHVKRIRINNWVDIDGDWVFLAIVDSQELSKGQSIHFLVGIRQCLVEYSE